MKHSKHSHEGICEKRLHFYSHSLAKEEKRNTEVWIFRSGTLVHKKVSWWLKCLMAICQYPSPWLTHWWRVKDVTWEGFKSSLFVDKVYSPSTWLVNRICDMHMYGMDVEKYIRRPTLKSTMTVMLEIMITSFLYYWHHLKQVSVVQRRHVWMLLVSYTRFNTMGLQGWCIAL